VTFHDGAAFTAEDVVASLERVRAESSDFKGLHTAVESAEAIDDTTVHVKMVGPSPLYVQNLTNFFIMDKGWIEANDVATPQDFKAVRRSSPSATRTAPGPTPRLARPRGADRPCLQ
jgi:peptide/nickel transport system substrate-binding protein